MNSPTSTAPQALSAALALAAQGYAVFPASPAKRPTSPHGCLDASTDPDRLRTLWQAHPGPLVAVATGEPSGASVLDLDRQHGALAWWEANRDRLPATRTHRTRDGGLHLWLRHLAGLRCSTARIAPGLDVRGDGGSAIWWPAAGLPVLSDAPLADWPAWLVPAPPPAPTPPALPTFTREGRARRYAEAAMRRAIAEVASAAPGTRNARLNAETYSLLRLVDAGAVTAAEVASAMAHAGIAAGLPYREVEATLASAIRARGPRA